MHYRSPRSRTPARALFSALAAAFLLAAVPARSGLTAELTLEEAWTALGSSDEAEAQAAMDALRQHGDAAAAFLAEQLTTVPGVTDKEVTRLIEHLDADDYDKRKTSTERLAELGTLVVADLRTASQMTDSLEALTRIDRLLTAPRRISPMRGDLSRHRRAIEVLTQMDTSASLQALGEIADRSRYMSTARTAAARFLEASQERMQSLLGEADRLAADEELDAALKSGRRALQLGRRAKLIDADTAAYLERAIRERYRVARRVATLRQKQDAGTLSEAERRELVRLLLIELDQPANAAEVAEDISDPHIQALLQLAQTPAPELPLDRQLELAAHCEHLAKDAGLLGTEAMLRRAKAIYGRAADAQPEESEAMADFRKRAARIQARLGDLRLDTPAWTNLLEMLDLEEGLTTGEWERFQAGVRVAAGDFATASIPVRPNGGYILEVTFMRTEGNDGVFIAVPVDDHLGNLNISGWGNTVSGLEWIDGKQANQNLTQVSPTNVDNLAAHRFRIKVTWDQHRATIRVRHNGAPYIFWQGLSEKLSKHELWQLDFPVCFAIGAHKSTVEFLSMRVKMLNRQLQPLNVQWRGGR